MPPKAQATASRGRPKRTAAPVPEPAVANASKKRGRVAKTQDVDEAAAAEPPKKRGRPAKTQSEEPVAVEEAPRRGGRRSNVAPADAPVETEAPTPKKRMGRPPKKETAASAATITEDAPAPKKRMGRPPKNATAPVDAPAATSKARPGRPSKAGAVEAAEETVTPKRRGRSSAGALDLSRVAGPSRVTKPRSKATPKKAVPPPRLNPRLRSKLRTRQPPTSKVKEEVAPAPTKRRGRPPKAEPAQVATPKQVKGNKVAQKATAKPVAPRKKRGYTTLEIPDKYAARVKQYFEDLVEADAEPSMPVEAEEEMLRLESEDAEPGAEVEVEEEEEEPVVIVQEETVIISATGATDEEDVLALAEQLDGAESSVEADVMDEGDNLNDMEIDAHENDIEEEITSDAFDEEQPEVTTAVEVELNIQQTAQAEEDMFNGAGGFTSEVNDKENAFDAHEVGFSSESSEENNVTYTAGAAPGATGGFLLGQGMLSL